MAQSILQVSCPAAAPVAHSLPQDSMPPPSPGQPAYAARFRPYASSKHTVTRGRYITSNDPRGYVYVVRRCAPACLTVSARRPVYEYPLNGQWLMVDSDNGYVLWTGIWKGARAPAVVVSPCVCSPCVCLFCSAREHERCVRVARLCPPCSRAQRTL